MSSRPMLLGNPANLTLSTGQRMPFIVGIGGSTRDDSGSERALRRALFFAEQHGARTQAVAGMSLPREMYSPADEERSVSANHLVDLLRQADGVIVASPAYHGSISGYLKNALDYTEDLRSDSRPYLDGRAMGLICCAMGPQAGVTTLAAMRSIAHALRAWPTPLGVFVNTSQSRFAVDCECDDLAIESQLSIMAAQVVEFCRARIALGALQAAAGV